VGDRDAGVHRFGVNRFLTFSSGAERVPIRQEVFPLRAAPTGLLEGEWGCVAHGSGYHAPWRVAWLCVAAVPLLR
jgi:hypothetical protein